MSTSEEADNKGQHKCNCTNANIPLRKCKKLHFLRVDLKKNKK